MFSKVLVANRGEIAARIIRALREMGVPSVAVYSEADAGSPHVLQADEAVCIGAAPVAESYLQAARIVETALDLGAEAIHPGYGLLSENAGFARTCAANGITFIGPTPEVIEMMGDKIDTRFLLFIDVSEVLSSPLNIFTEFDPNSIPFNRK